MSHCHSLSIIIIICLTIHIFLSLFFSISLSLSHFQPHILSSHLDTFRYVKRELRSLTIADREMFLDAAVMMWKYNTSAGLQKFGTQFTSTDEFVAVHALASNDIMCDGFHEGYYTDIIHFYSFFFEDSKSIYRILFSFL